MTGFPQLLQEDLDEIDAILNGVLTRSGATFALFVHRNGPLLRACGATGKLDTVALASLASNAYNAGELLLVGQLADRGFSSVTMNGENFSATVMDVDEECLLLIAFKTTLTAGAVRSTAMPAVMRLREQLRKAHARNPELSYDLVDLNNPDVLDLFKKKE
ncbi:MAG: hypothetical protein HY300_02075 [Verrucomicrobia bacterium]|nr:hypothetical protein [Verrucomicrobiota bacterium]